MQQGKPNPDTPQAQATLVQPMSWAWGGLALIPFLLLLAFHVGAGWLSYQKYGSMGWAFLNFIFAYFYYPYYAFFLAKDPGPSAGLGMVGGRKTLAKVLLGKWLK